MSLATKPFSSATAKELILAGDAPPSMTVSGHLDLSGSTELRELPDELTVHSLNVSGCSGLQRLPTRLNATLLRLDNCSSLMVLPVDLRCRVLEFRNGSLRRLPSGLRVTHKLDLAGCVFLTELPEGLTVQILNLQRCQSLAALPAVLDVAELEIAHTGITQLPVCLGNIVLRWRGVVVTERVVFHPETFSVEEILTEPNLEVRRILIERVGYDWLFKQASPTILDSDRDAGGDRILRLIPLQRNEDLTCLSVSCPSTGRNYTLRVPPGIRSCRQAAAWLAGFDKADDYRPVVET